MLQCNTPETIFQVPNVQQRSSITPPPAYELAIGKPAMLFEEGLSDAPSTEEITELLDMCDQYMAGKRQDRPDDEKGIRLPTNRVRRALIDALRGKAETERKYIQKMAELQADLILCRAELAYHNDERGRF